MRPPEERRPAAQWPPPAETDEEDLVATDEQTAAGADETQSPHHAYATDGAYSLGNGAHSAEDRTWFRRDRGYSAPDGQPDPRAGQAFAPPGEADLAADDGYPAAGGDYGDAGRAGRAAQDSSPDQGYAADRGYASPDRAYPPSAHGYPPARGTRWPSGASHAPAGPHYAAAVQDYSPAAPGYSPSEPDYSRSEPGQPASVRPANSRAWDEAGRDDAAVPVRATPVADPGAVPQPADIDRRWSEILAMFVDDPRASVEQAAGLTDRAVENLVSSLRQRQASLASAWQDPETGTEALRGSLREYRAFWALIRNLPAAAAAGQPPASAGQPTSAAGQPPASAAQPPASAGQPGAAGASAAADGERRGPSAQAGGEPGQDGTGRARPSV